MDISPILLSQQYQLAELVYEEEAASIAQHIISSAMNDVELTLTSSLCVGMGRILVKIDHEIDMMIEIPNGHNHHKMPPFLKNKEVKDWFKKIEAFWDKINKNTTKVLSELPSVYPKVYEIMSDTSLTLRELYAKIRILKLDCTVARSLHAVAMAVTHSGGQDPYLSMNAEVFLEKLTGGKVRRHVYRHRFRN
ncbi:hypothetical protein Aduo_016696 [Ancylostoma duodenale]